MYHSGKMLDDEIHRRRVFDVPLCDKQSDLIEGHVVDIVRGHLKPLSQQAKP